MGIKIINFGQSRRRRGKYSEKEKRAYDAGRAYAKAKNGERMGLKTEKEKQSFKNGFNSVKKGGK